MNTLMETFKRNLLSTRFFYTSGPIVVGASAGPDSLSLLQLLAEADLHRQIVVAHVNHDMRLQGNVEEEYLKQYCHAHHFTFESVRWDRRLHPETGIELAGREFRYHFFAEVLEKYHAPVLMTAHQEDEQIETILMRLIRGGQLQQLIGIHPERRFASAWLIRPLLNISKATLIQFLMARQVQFYEDATNEDETYTRNRIRHELLPLMVQENAQVVEHIEAYRQQLADLITFSTDRVDQIIGEHSDDNQQLVLTDWSQFNDGTRRLVLRRWLENWGVIAVKDATVRQIQLLIAQPQPQGSVNLPGQQRVVKRYSRLTMEPAVVSTVEFDHELQVDEPVLLPNGETLLLRQQKHSQIWLPPTAFPLRVRTWRHGDQIRLKNGHHQTVRRVLINAKVANNDRKMQAVVVTADDEVIWVVDHKLSYLNRPADYQASWQGIEFVKKSSQLNKRRL